MFKIDEVVSQSVTSCHECTFGGACEISPAFFDSTICCDVRRAYIKQALNVVNSCILISKYVYIYIYISIYVLETH